MKIPEEMIHLLEKNEYLMMETGVNKVKMTADKIMMFYMRNRKTDNIELQETYWDNYEDR